MHTYLIRPGKHKSKGYRFLFKRARNIKFKVSSNFNTVNNNNPNQGWSKLFGYSDSFIHHHRNSIRIGLRIIDGQLWTAAYYYRNGERSWLKIMPIEYDTVYTARIDWTDDMYMVGINDITVFVPRSGKCITYPLFPYIGGRYPASSLISIYISYED